MILLLASTGFAHRQHAHQYICMEGYNLLRMHLGFDVPSMHQRIGGMEPFFAGDYAWQRGYVTTGAWREDEEDAVYGYSRSSPPTLTGITGSIYTFLAGFGGLTPDGFVSSTHFWYADDGDDANTDMRACIQFLGNHVTSFTIPNAYQKFLRYINGGWAIRYNFGTTVGAPPGYCVPESYPVIGIAFEYENLIEFFKTGRAFRVGFRDINGNWQYCSGTEIYYVQSFREKVAWEILGRMCHLLQDMSVPAHANIDPHGDNACLISDYYEGYFGDDFYWNAQNVSSQIGGLINPYQFSSPLHALMYVTNQMANHFASQGPHKRPHNDHFGGNPRPDEHSYLSALNIPQFGIPTSDNGPWGYDAIFNVRERMFPQAIRATAGILYWFAMETDLLQNSHVRNSFGGGTLRIDGSTLPSGYRAPAWGNPGSLTLEAIDQVYAGNNHVFTRWRKLVNGTEVESWTTRQIVVVPTANTRYEAVFEIVAPVISGFTQTPVPIYRPGSGTVTCNLSEGNCNITYTWTANYVPSSVYVSFSGNRAEIQNGYFRPAGSQTPAKAAGGGGEPNNPEGLFMLTCTASNSAGSSTSTFYPFLDYGPPPPPPGGCPFVYAWKDSGYAVDNNILPQSQLPENEGHDVTDYYQMFVSPSLEDDKYVLAVGEFENEHSFLDQTRLLVIDHDPDVFITIDDSGTVIQFAKPAIFADAQLDSTEVLKYLEKLDGVNVETAKDDTMRLSFTRDGGSYQEGLLLVGQVPVKEAIAGRVMSKNTEQSVTFSNFRLRRNMSYTWVLVPTADTSTVQIDIEWSQDAAVDYSELSKKLELPFTLQEAPLLLADHSSLGDVTGNLLAWDETYTELMPQEWVRLEFQAPPVAQGSKRSFVFVSRGRYVSLQGTSPSVSRGSTPNATTTGMLQSVNTLPSEFSVSKNYPNPFNPTTVIKYQLPKDSYVTLRLYDILGREVGVLVDGMKEAGYHEVSFDASRLASGMYLYSLKAGDFTSVRKLVLLR